MKHVDNRNSDPREVELKLHLPPSSRPALEGSSAFAAAEAKQHHLMTTYFDTSDGVLDGAGLTLRVRRSGDRRIQTLKSRANGRSIATDRIEWEWQIGQDGPDVGRLAEIKALAETAQAINGRLQPVFVTDIRRTVRLLHLDGNTVVEAAIDEGSIKAGAACEPVSELELELKTGCLGPLYRLAAELQTLTPLWISPESKAARGWHLHTGRTEGARKAQTLKVRRRDLASDGFHEIISCTLGHLMGNIAPTLRGDAEAMHQMHIALRGARAALKLFELHLDTAAAGRFDADLQCLGRIFGTARDWDVFCLEALPAAMADLPAEQLQELNLVADAERHAAHTAVENAMCGKDFTALVLGMTVWVEAGPAQICKPGDNDLGKRLQSIVPSLLDRVARRAKKRGRHAGQLSAEELHRLRKSLKKLSYGVEHFGGLYRRRAVKAYRRRCEDLAEILGSANDAVATKRLALKLVTDSRPDLAKRAGVLVVWSERKGRKAMKAFKGALKSYRSAPSFWSL